MTMPPLAVPSSFASMMPVTLIALPKFFRLGDRVLTRGGIEHQQHLVRRVFNPPGNDIADLGQLAHQIVLRVQSPGGVNDQHIDTPALGSFAGVVRDGRGIGAHFVLDDFHTQAIRPDGELIHGRGAKGIAGADHHFFLPFVFQQPRELGDAGGLARAVDAGDEDDRGPDSAKCSSRESALPHPATICSITTRSASSAFLILPNRQRSRTSATSFSTFVTPMSATGEISPPSQSETHRQSAGRDMNSVRTSVLSTSAVFFSAPLSLSSVLEKKPMRSTEHQ